MALPVAPFDKAGVSNISIIFMLVAFFIFALADTTTKFLALAGFSAFQLAFMRYIVHFVITLSETSVRGIKREEITENWALLLARCVCLAVGTVLTFYSFKHLSLTMVSAILFLSPTFVSLLSWPLLGERVGPWRWGAIIFGFVGVLVIIRPFNEAYNPAAILPMIVAFCLGLYSIITRKLAYRVRPHVMQFCVGAFGTAVFLPLALWVWQPIDWINGVMMAWVGFAGWFGHELLTRAHKMTPANVLMPYSYSFILYMTALGYLVFGEVPDVMVFVGAGIVISSGLVIWHRERVRRGVFEGALKGEI